MQKIKIVWLCHFSNQQVRNRLPLSKTRVLSVIKRIMGRGEAGGSFDFAPWITQMADLFEKFEDVELHIVAPHRGLSRNIYEFEMRGINYHFFRSDLPMGITQIMENVRPSIDNYYIARRNVINLINKIKPDIINLIGAENAYFSSTILAIDQYPVIVTTQTVYANPDRLKYAAVNKLAWDNELNIFAKEMYYAVTNKHYCDLIRSYNANANVLKFSFPTLLPKIEGLVEKRFDFVFFSLSLTNKKGADDALEALALVKRKFKNVSLKMVGNETLDRMNFLKNKVKELDLEPNVEFISSFELQSDLFQYIAGARFALLPVKLDFISGTILQAMSLGLPVVTYATSGTPSINKNKECVLIAPLENTKQLAEHMIRLLDSSELSCKLRENSFEFVNDYCNNEKAMRLLVDDYRAVIAHYNEGTKIPSELLYD